MDHPAKFSDNILVTIRSIVDGWHLRTWGSDEGVEQFRLLDPFAGTGRIHSLDRTVNNLRPYQTVGVEIEPEWAALDKRTIIGNALYLPFPDAWFDGAVTSPVYGNRMSDHHVAKDLCGLCQGVGYEAQDVLCTRCKGTGLSVRRTYRHTLGRGLHSQNAGQLQWGPVYRDFHVAAWVELHRVLKPGAPFLLNVSDHIRGGERIKVTNFHINTLLDIGFDLVAAQTIQTPRMRYGVNHENRAKHEMLITFEKAA